MSDPTWHPKAGESATLSIRPESWTITGEFHDVNTVQGRIGESIYLGEFAQYEFRTGSQVLKIFEMNPHLSNRSSERELFASTTPQDVVVLRGLISCESSPFLPLWR